MGLLAEYIVNNIDYLPDHYITAELWNTYGSEFEPVESNPEIVLLHDVTHEAGRRLIESVETLKSMLKSTRSDLSLEFDVPYVTELAHAS